MVVLMLSREEKLARIELFELEHLDAALARFEELLRGEDAVNRLPCLVLPEA
jgi:hypothetical protein